jgi:CubicO group peptidase (beta-lactamase class C family)
MAQSGVEKAIAEVQKQLETELPRSVGGAVAILHKGKVVYQKTVGHVYHGGPAVDENTYFSMGSTSKPIIALVVHDLVARGVLKLDTWMSSLIPQVPAGVELQHVLSHTSGYTYRGNADIEQGKKRPVVLDLLFKSPLSAPSGKTFVYNNIVYSLLEDAVSKATGKPWPVVFHETMEARGLGHLALMDPGPTAAVAYPHRWNSRKKTFEPIDRLPKHYPSEMSASAGVFASLQDLIAFAKLQFTEELSPWQEPRTAALDALYWKSALLAKKKIHSRYALGWRVFELKEDPAADMRMIFHGGFVNGVSAFIGVMKKQDLAIVAMVNDNLFAPQRAGIFLWSQLVLSGERSPTQGKK